MFKLKESEIVKEFIIKLINSEYSEGDSYVLNDVSHKLGETLSDIPQVSTTITVILADGYQKTIFGYKELIEFLNDKFPRQHIKTSF